MNNLQDLTSFINYFRQLQAQHKELKGFVHGPAARTIGLDRSELEYPALWLETPTFTPSENGADHTSGTWSAGIIVLTKTGDMDFAQEDIAWSDTLRLMQSILSRIKRDLGRSFEIGRKPIDPISPMFVTNVVGWRLEIEIEDYLDLCYKPEDWKEIE